MVSRVKTGPYKHYGANAPNVRVQDRLVMGIKIYISCSKQHLKNYLFLLWLNREAAPRLPHHEIDVVRFFLKDALAALATSNLSYEELFNMLIHLETGTTWQN